MLSQRLPLLRVVGLALLPLLIVAAFALWRETDVREERIESRQLATAQSASLAAESFVTAQFGILESLAADLAGADDESIAALGERLARIRAANPTWEGLSLVDAEGWNTASSNSPPGTVYIGDRDYFQRALTTGERALSSAIIGRVSGLPTVIFAVPVELAGGERHVLIAPVPTGELAATLEARLGGDDLEFLIVDTLGQAFIAPGNGDPGTLVNVSERPEVRAALAGEAGSDVSDLGGDEHVVAYAPVEGAGWGVVVSQPEAAALAPVRGTLLLGGALLGVAMVTVGSVTWYFGGRLGRSYEGLQAARLEAERAQADAEEHADMLATLNGIGRVLAADLDLDRSVQRVTDLATEAVGAQFGAFFYNRVDRRGESFTLYALSGADRSAFEQFPLPRNTALFGPTFRGEGTVRIDDVRADPRYGHSEPYYGLPSGHLPVCSYLAVPVFDRSGEVLGGLFFGHDEPGVFDARDEQIVEGIAGYAAVVIENARLYEQAQQAIAIRDEFLGIAAHELKTPLTVLKGYSGQLARRLEQGSLRPEHLQEAIGRLTAYSRRLEVLTEELLDTSRIQRGRLQIRPAPMDLAALAAEVLDRFREDAARSHRLALDAPEPVHGQWDRERLDQVLTNLVDNALKYSPAGGDVCVAVRALGEEALLAVTDEGVGIPPDEQPHIFEPFRRGQAGEQVTQGIGLGLYITSQLIAQHGGRIEVESEPGRGTTFKVLLPLAMATV